jgi:solute carrier family 35 (adenosine 3'-phospho 5'-phosphosulfate transporter), member B2
VLIFSGQLIPSLQFSIDYPDFLLSSLGLSICATGGQIVIYYTIKMFGALFFAIVMTTRQVFSMLLSCIIYFHPLSIGQWFGAAIVFAVLYYKGFVKKPHTSQGSK